MMRVRARPALGATAVALAALVGATRAEDLGVAARVKTKTLTNGLRVVVLERRQAPVIAFATTVRVGSVDEPRGVTGIAHVFEHMAFKGSTTLGTKDYAKEKIILDEIEEVFAKLKAARQAGDKAIEESLAKKLEELRTKAGDYVVPEEYSTLIQRHGGAGLNAWTGSDCTCYHVELPSNRLELFLALEADRFARPVLREFYKEKEAVEEERRLRTDSSPAGKLMEEFTAIAFKAHAYGQPTLGHVSDLDALSARDAATFYARYYTPNNTTIAIVGDVAADEAFALAEKYFAAIPRGPDAPPVHTLEPSSEGEKRVVVEAKAQPVLILGWHRAPSAHKDNATLNALVDLLATGRGSRLYKSLVVEKKVAVSVESYTGYPGDRYANLLVVGATPAPGKTTDDCVRAIDDETRRLKRELVPEDELTSVKVRNRAGLIRGLRSLDGMAQGLAVSQSVYGDWQELFLQVDRIEKVTPDDVRRVAKTLFLRKNRVRGEIVAPEADDDDAGASSSKDGDAKKSDAKPVPSKAEGPEKKKPGDEKKDEDD